jgi:hypothetical protein
MYSVSSPNTFFPFLPLTRIRHLRLLGLLMYPTPASLGNLFLEREPAPDINSLKNDPHGSQ